MLQTLWLVWLIIVLVALLAELLSLGLFFGSLAIAAGVVAVASLFIPFPFQIVLFSALSLVLALAVRPVVLRVLPRAAAANAPPNIGPVGRRALATEPITSLHGQIRVGVGEFWSARPEVEATTILPGSEVDVVRLDGLTAVVRPAAQVPAPEEVRPDSTMDNPFGLTARELGVLQLVALGSSNADIAGRLVISERTVDHHVSHILHKMDVRTRVEAVRLAVQRGLVSLDSGRPRSDTDRG